MNSKNISKGLLLGASLFLATAAFAGEKASVKDLRSVSDHIVRSVVTGTGPDVQLNIRKGNDTVASAPAKLTPVANAPAGSGYSTKAEGDGSKSLTSVFIAGKKYTIELGAEVAAAPAKSSETAGNQ